MDQRHEHLRNLSETQRIELIRELRDKCYETWMANPDQTVELAVLAGEIESVSASVEIASIAEWLRGIQALTRGELESSIELLQRSADGFKSIGLELDRAEACVSMTVPLAILGRYDEAAAASEDALEVFKKNDRIESAGKAEHNLGNIRLRQERFDEAETILISARKRFLDGTDVDKLVQIDNCLAMAISYQHRFVEAKNIYQRVSEKAKDAGLKVTEAEIESNLGALALLQADFDGALLHYQSSHDIYSDLGMEHQAAIAEQEIADVYLELRLLPEAERLYRKARELFARLGMTAELAHANLFLARSLIELGLVHEAAIPLGIAKECYEKEDNPTGGAKVELALAHLDILKDHTESAKKRATQSAEHFAAVSYWGKLIEALIVSGEAELRAGSVYEAQAIFKRALSESDKRRVPHLKLPCLAALGRLALIKNLTYEAEEYFTDAIELTEAIRAPIRGEEFRSAFVNDKMAPYKGLLQLHLQRGEKHDLIRGFAIAEQMRARSLSELMLDNSIRRLDHDPFTEVIYDELTQIREELTWLYRRQFQTRPEQSVLQQIESREFEYSELNRRLAKYQLPPKRDVSATTNINRLQYLLGDSATLVEYVQVNDRYKAFVITEGDIAVYELGFVAEVDELIAKARSSIDKMQRAPAGGPSSDAVYSMRRMLAALYEKLIGPMRGELRHQRIAIIPIGTLNYVPFHALFDGLGYLVESADIVTAPSASILMSCSERKEDPSGKAVLVGVSDEYIPQVREEVRQLAAEIPKSVMLLDDDAKRGAVVEHAKRSKLLHLACHGRFRSDNPMYSNLQLADGFLNVRDVYQLDLTGCGLVVLSGCETGLSLVDPGNEVIGLIRGFLAAGARSMILSGWQVADEATYHLFKGFYRNLLNGKSASTALCAVQRSMIKEGKSPFYWASFSASGWW